MATNITAVGYIGKNLANRNRVFYNGLMYTLGRTVSYTVLALILFFGADQLRISGVFQQYGEKIIGPLRLLTNYREDFKTEADLIIGMYSFWG